MVEVMRLDEDASLGVWQFAQRVNRFDWELLSWFPSM